jgi:hypothetical protein
MRDARAERDFGESRVKTALKTLSRQTSMTTAAGSN